ncbi:MAG: glycosyltransferase [Deltaproteobacteria bacterium]|nr:glycosyltransferase [Deltaproteobacteria bacterium]MCL5878583.1 glycosyltransferase [Deltaproteobacteria bacterium]
MEPGVSIIIPNYNGRHLLERFLPSIISACKFYTGKSEIIIVDDSSTDDSIEFLNGIDRVKVVKKQGPRGFSRTCNKGATFAQYDILIFLNNDVEVNEDFITSLVEHFVNLTVFAVTCKSYGLPVKKFRDGGKLYEFKKGFFKVHRNYDIADAKDVLVNDKLLLSFMFSAAHSAVRKSMFLEIGGFDEKFSPFNWEDADLSYRGLKRGWEIHYEPRSIVYHMGNVTINSYHKKLLVRMISKRNRLLMLWKNLRDPSFVLKHTMYLTVWLVLYSCIANFVEVGAFFMALRHLPYILRTRKKEKIYIKKSDKEIMDIFHAFVTNNRIKIIN